VRASEGPRVGYSALSREQGITLSRISEVVRERCEARGLEGQKVNRAHSAQFYKSYETCRVCVPLSCNIALTERRDLEPCTESQIARWVCPCCTDP
jgi:hypothetical protein